MPLTAIIIPHYRDIERLDRCLKSLIGQADETVEICVVDNDSQIDMSQITNSYPAIRLVTEEQKGAGAARNRGVQETTADILLFIDADCVAAPDWVAHGIACINRADLIGGRVDIFNETPPPGSGAEAFEAVFAFNMRDYIENKGFCGSGNLATTRGVFHGVGGFMTGMSEDVEWSQRAIGKGYSLVYDDDFIVSHPARQDWAALRRKWLRTTQEAFELAKGRGVSRMKWMLRAFIVAASPLGHFYKPLLSKRLSTITEKRRAIGTLFRLRLTRSYWMVKQAMGLKLS